MSPDRMIEPGTPEAVKARAQLTNNVLPVLVARAGGSVEITREEFAEVAARYGGPSQISIHFEQTGGGAAVKVTLVRNPRPRQGELPT